MRVRDTIGNYLNGEVVAIEICNVKGEVSCTNYNTINRLTTATQLPDRGAYAGTVFQNLNPGWWHRVSYGVESRTFYVVDENSDAYFEFTR